MFLLPHCSSTLHFYVVSGIYGLAIAPLTVLDSTALVNMVGMNGLSTAYGITETIYGIGFVVGPTLIGMAHNYFESFQLPFYFAGGSFAIGVAISFITSIVHFRGKY